MYCESRYDRGSLGSKVGEHVQVRGQRRAFVHVLAVAARPEERLSGGALETGEVDLAALEDRSIPVGEILADHGDHPDGRKMARGQSEIARGASERAVNLAMRCFDAVECDRTHNQK